MKKIKTVIILSLLCFIIPNAFAKSLDSVKGIESLIDGGKITSQSIKSTLKTKTKEKNNELETEYQAEPIYLGNFQFDLEYAWETIDYYAYNSDSNDYSSHEHDTFTTYAFNLENHNLFRITPFKKINIYAGFMESLSFGIHLHNVNVVIFETSIGGEIAVKFSKVALVQAALGLDVGFLFPGIIAPAFFFDFQTKFFPNAGFSPVIGMSFTKFITKDDLHPLYILSNALYLGGSWNFRSKHRH